MYSRRTWTRDAVGRLSGYDLSRLRSESKHVHDDKVVAWCDERLAAIVAQESAKRERIKKRHIKQRKAAEMSAKRVDAGLVPEHRHVSEYERESCGMVVAVSDHMRRFWVKHETV
jgi:hypothetical protein